MKVFIEEQRFNNKGILILAITPLIGAIIPFATSDEGFPEVNSSKFWALLLILVVGFLVFGLFKFMKLKTRIDEKGISYRFPPNQSKNKLITWSEIDAIEILEKQGKKRLAKYGYDKCLFGKKGTSIYLGGKTALKLHLKNGRYLLLGTHKELELKRTIANYNTEMSYDG